MEAARTTYVEPQKPMDDVIHVLMTEFKSI